jgi:hypothetical protein
VLTQWTGVKIHVDWSRRADSVDGESNSTSTGHPGLTEISNIPPDSGIKSKSLKSLKVKLDMYQKPKPKNIVQV